MKINWTTIILLAVIAIMAYGLFRQCNKTEHYSDLIEWKSDTLQSYKDEKGRWIAEKTSLQISHSIAKNQLEKELQQVREDLKIKSRKLNSITYLNTQTEDQIKIEKSGPLTFKNQFTTIAITDTGRFYGLNYQIRDSLLITGYWKREKWFKPQTLKVKAISYNPNTIITGLDQVEIKGKPTRFSVSLQVGYGFTNSGLSPYAGVGVGFELFRF